jgi:HEAT repeat protein
MRPTRLLVPILAVLSLLPVQSRAEELPKAEGVDVVKVGKAIAGALSRPESSVAQGKAWEADIAGLTDTRPEVHTQAMSSLIRRGQPVVGDLRMLAKDQDPKLRMRVAAVLAAIGGEQSTEELLSLSRDSDRGVVEMATLGLGKARGVGSYERLAEILASSEPSVRQAAARGLGLHGDPQAMGLLCGYMRDRDDLVRRDMREQLARIAIQAKSVPVLASLISTRSGAERLALIDATASIGDPRLSPVLAQVLEQNDLATATLAARMLSVNGDSRAVEALCRTAAKSRDALLREQSAITLRRLTGHTAAAGIAWELWWRDHAAEIAALVPRDQLLADLHDPARTTTSAELAPIPVAQLTMLVDGALGQGAPWWPACAFAALAADVPARWTTLLFERIDRTPETRERVRLIVLLDELGDPAARDGFRKLYAALRDQPEVKAAALGPERAALRHALERRGDTVR